MTDLLIRVMNLSVASQRAIASAIVFVIGVSISALSWVAFSLLNGNAAAIEENRLALARFEATIAVGRAMLKQPTISATASEFLVGENEAVIQANLQNRLNSLAGSAMVTVLSSGGIPSVELDGVRYVGIRANMQGSLKAIHGALLQLETGKPYLIVREMVVHVVNQGRSPGPVELSVQLSFLGALDPTASNGRKAGAP